MQKQLIVHYSGIRKLPNKALQAKHEESWNESIAIAKRIREIVDEHGQWTKNLDANFNWTYITPEAKELHERDDELKAFRDSLHGKLYFDPVDFVMENHWKHVSTSDPFLYEYDSRYSLHDYSAKNNPTVQIVASITRTEEEAEIIGAPIGQRYIIENDELINLKTREIINSIAKYEADCHQKECDECTLLPADVSYVYRTVPAKPVPVIEFYEISTAHGVIVPAGWALTDNELPSGFPVRKVQKQI